ncbi:MAG: FAD-dependent oxidoreductase [Candidatus Caldarchaeum sp.]|nr:FAD-dependent oxidoreductase [Candidatus Caldarchaeum sp.]
MNRGAASLRPSWDYVYDVVVVGLGAAGAAAAITAAEKGCKVLVVEKTGEGGGNSKMSAAFICPDSKDEAVKYITHLKLIERGKVDEEERKVIEAYVEEAVGLVDWIKQLGGEVEPGPVIPGYPKQPVGPSFPEIPGSGSMKRYRVSGMEVRGGESLFKLLMSKVRELGVDVFFNTAAKDLICVDNEVVGVLAERGGVEVRIKALKAVVLACGGFEYSEELKRTFLGTSLVHGLGNPANTGDGVKMAMKLGAALWNMDSFAGYPGFKPETTPYAFPIRMWVPAFIYVDKHGNRFMNETAIEAHISCLPLLYFDPVKLEYPRIPSHVIFDEKNMEAGPLSPHRAVYGEWSADNLAELEKGWIVKADTVERLAERLGLPPNSLKTTVSRYNDMCSLGVDMDFGRRQDELMPIEGPPFYGIKIWPCVLNTQGGPRRNSRAQVLHASGKPIKRLYSAGELGSMWGKLYQSAGNVAECLAFGRIAGRNASEEAPSTA